MPRRWRRRRAALAPMGLIVAGEDPRRAHRRGLRLPRVPHPSTAETGNTEALRLHHPVQEGRAGGQGQGAVEDAQVDLHLSLAELLTSLNQTLRGWANYFGTGCRRGPSTISTSTPGGGRDGSAPNTRGPGRLGRSFAAVSVTRDGGSPPRGRVHRRLQRQREPLAATAAASSEPPGHRHRRPPPAADLRPRHVESPVR